MTLIILILVYAAIAIVQIPRLARKKHRRELLVFTCFLLLAFIFSALLSLDVKIPSPLILIQHEIQDRLNLHY